MPEDLEALLGKVFRHYEGMLRVAFPDDEATRQQYEEYFANILDGVTEPEQLGDIVKKMTSLSGL